MMPRVNAAHETVDVAIVGAGAAGLMTAIWIARRRPAWRVVALDGAARLGAKILVAGGGRCNVTNARVTPADYETGNRNILKRVLAAWPVAETVAFFQEAGVALHEEAPFNKLFPDSNEARTVLEALLRATQRAGAAVRTSQRVTTIERAAAGFQVHTARGLYAARHVVLATGGQSLPKSGSDGLGYKLAQSLGHTLVPLTPALEPLVLAPGFHKELAGVSHEVELTVAVPDEKPVRRQGPLLWTHFGISGPVTLDISRHWHRGRLTRGAAALMLNCWPACSFEAGEQRIVAAAAARPRLHVDSLLGETLPQRVAHTLLGVAGIAPHLPLGQLTRDQRRRLVHTLTALPLPVTGGRGYNYAEATAGGVDLNEVDAQLASRVCPGLYLVGEILDVDGRIGGFNFQWAWSSGFVAARAIANDG